MEEATAKYTEKFRIKCNQGAIRAVRYNVDGEYLLTCGADRTLKLWNPERSLLLSTYAGHSGPVLDARGSNDNAQLISGSTDKNVSLWDVSTSRMMRRWRGHNSSITSVLFNEESTLVISGSQDNSVKIWDVRSRSLDPIQTLNEPKDAVNSMALDKDKILVGSSDGYARLYDIRQGQMHEYAFPESLTSVGISRDSASILCSVADGSVNLIDVGDGTLLAKYTGHNTDPQYHDYKIEASLDNTDQLVFASNPFGSLYIFDLISEKVKQIVSIDDTGLAVVSLCPHPSKLIVACAVGTNIVILQDNSISYSPPQAPL